MCRALLLLLVLMLASCMSAEQRKIEEIKIFLAQYETKTLNGKPAVFKNGKRITLEEAIQSLEEIERLDRELVKIRRKSQRRRSGEDMYDLEEEEEEEHTVLEYVIEIILNLAKNAHAFAPHPIPLSFLEGRSAPKLSGIPMVDLDIPKRPRHRRQPRPKGSRDYVGEMLRKKGTSRSYGSYNEEYSFKDWNPYPKKGFKPAKEWGSWDTPATPKMKSPWEPPKIKAPKSIWDTPAPPKIKSPWDTPRSKAFKSSWDTPSTPKMKSPWDIPKGKAFKSSWDTPATPKMKSPWDTPSYSKRKY